MQRYVLDHPVLKKTAITDANQTRHITHIRRLNPGDNLVLCGSDGACFWMTIDEAEAHRVTLTRGRSLPKLARQRHLSFAQALISPEHFTMVCQKAIELGVDTVYPLITNRTVAELNPVSFTGTDERNTTHDAVTFHASMPLSSLDLTVFDTVLVAYEDAPPRTLRDALKRVDKHGRLLVVVGPEGGFSEDDLAVLNPHATFISLGQRIMRSDTAAIAALSVIMHELEVIG